MEFDEKISRRNLIKGAAGVAGVAALTAGGLGLLSKAEAAAPKGATLPYPYKKFTAAEIKEAGNIAHAAWFKGFCSYATLIGGIEILRRKVGEPYTSFPVELTTFAHGGTSGWGGTCGTLIGAGVLSSLCAGPKIGEALIMRYAISMRRQRSDFVPITQRLRLKQQAPAIHLCHLSVGKWMEEGRIPESSADGPLRQTCGRHVHENS
jgi:hypothetical protein